MSCNLYCRTCMFDTREYLLFRILVRIINSNASVDCLWINPSSQITVVFSWKLESDNCQFSLKNVVNLII